MIIERYYNLTHRERGEIICKLVIALESSDLFYDKLLDIISEAEENGVYEKRNVGDLSNDDFGNIPPLPESSNSEETIVTQS